MQEIMRQDQKQSKITTEGLPTKILEVGNAASMLLRDLGKWLDWACPKIPAGASQGTAPGPIRGKGQNDLEKATSWLERMPKQQVINDAYFHLGDAIEGKATPPEIELLVAIMIDAYPHAKPDKLMTYVNLLTYAADVQRGYSVSVISTAIIKSVLENKFLPTISELIAECDAQEALFKGALAKLGRFEDLRNSAVETVIEFGSVDELNRLDPPTLEDLEWEA